MPDLHALDRNSLLALTVRGRKSDKPYTVKIWFVVGDGVIYVSSGRGSEASWIKNLRHKPEVTLEIGETTLRGTAALVDSTDVETQVLPLFYKKYFLARVFRWFGWYKEKFAFVITPHDELA